MILSFIILMGIVFGYMSYSGIEEPIVSDEIRVVSSKEELESLKSFSIDFAILDDETYKNLEIFGENPVDPGITGERVNPFDPL